ncbi:MAG: Glutaconate CoA-transferase [Microgenomates group bacterium GW2011_GWA2_46_7]|nr:MAG: Glutaconate CoA-transferase [Microgenomates group bacterium GW2011_GWA2_46_7]
MPDQYAGSIAASTHSFDATTRPLDTVKDNIISTAVTTLVSNLGIFEKLDNEPELTLTGYFSHPPLSTKEETVRYIKDHCGWELKVSPDPQKIPPPTRDELLLLRTFDPYRYFIGDSV